MLDYDPVASDPAVEDDTKGKNTQLTRFKGWYHYHPDLANLPPSAIPIQLSLLKHDKPADAEPSEDAVSRAVPLTGPPHRKATEAHAAL